MEVNVDKGNLESKETVRNRDVITLLNPYRNQCNEFF